MTKLTFIVDHDMQYGMSRESLRVLCRIVKDHYSVAQWDCVVGKHHKITMKSAHGPSVVLTYTGIVSMMANPEKSSVVFSHFLNLVSASFRDPRSVHVLSRLVRVVKPQWNVSIGEIY